MPEIEPYEVAFIIGVPLFFSILIFFGTQSVGVAAIIFVLGLLGMFSLYGHEHRGFRFAGAVIGSVVGTALAFAHLTGGAPILFGGIIGGLVGYVIARWGYWILEFISHAN